MGIKMKIDNLGRVTIPFQMRNELNIGKNDLVDVDLRGGKIIIANDTPVCAICGAREELTKIKGKFLCVSCLKTVKEAYH